MMSNERTAQLDELIKVAKAGFEHYKPSFDKLNNAYLLYLEQQQLESLKQRNKSRLYIPKINSKAKRIADALSETYFNNDTFAVLETYINSKQEVIDKWQKVLDIYTSMLRLYNTFAPMFQKIPFLGTSVAKVYWSNDMPVIEEIELDDIYFDPNAKSVSDIRFIVNKINLTTSDLLRLAKKKVFNKKMVDELIDSVTMNQTTMYERVMLYDVYELIDDKWYLSTIYDNSVILRDMVELKDGQPFIFGYMTPQVRSYEESNFVCAYGEPPLASILPLQDEMNITRNGFIDGVNACLKPKIVAPLSANISRADIETIGKPIFTENPTAISFVPLPSLQSAQVNITLIDNEMSEASGISPQQNGATTTRKETATMASIMANEGSVRLQGYIRTYNETFFEPVFERLAKLVWKYGQKEFFAGYDRSEIPSFAVNLNTGIGALNKEVQKQGLIQASGAISNHINLCMGLQDIQTARRMLNANFKIIEQLLPLYGIKNVDEFLDKEPNVFNEQGENLSGYPESMPSQQGLIPNMQGSSVQGLISSPSEPMA
ncbi:portal protein [Campylobacter pinnipediorum]|uniref:Phage head-tail adapter protein n=1 Tax=Campylobacter pinnipediorum subsp. pinnipediorum TaxID=1660067 RepID=A0AAX0L9N3_9BACT|nr:phage head-tail adapter protein [Campylobacter pinnipediorum]OPA77341.1 phage head-tail adapter protein [Campylobacter pinnipediorum subsp. pinnipediorum]